MSRSNVATTQAFTMPLKQCLVTVVLFAVLHPVSATDLATELRDSAECGLTPLNAHYCKYSVPWLEIELAGIGQPNAAFYFNKVEDQQRSSAGMGISHNCVFAQIVPGPPAVPQTAYISPHTGKVYAEVDRKIPKECFD